MGYRFSKELTDLNAGKILAEDTVMRILDELKLLLMQTETLIEIQSPVVIVGDIHGQYEDLQELFRTAEIKNKTPESTRFLFMGDYVDRGHFSLNTFLLLATYKLSYQDRIFLLRGNHECRQVTMQYGLHTECVTNYGHSGIWTALMRIFDLLPSAALIDNCVFSVHGGLSPELPFIRRLATIRRIQELPDNGILADLAWSDPGDFKDSDFRPNSRGAGYLFGENALHKFCRLNKLKLMTRSHQLAKDGYQWHFPTKSTKEGPIKGKLLTVWSAPNYCYTQKNAATFLLLEDPMTVELVPFKESAARIVWDHVEIVSDYFA
jgi:diadenosine tetraphosphatase ApaH/serine/threonine PP2A family protein phosphatase